jgi:hypothetical protein
MNTRMIKLQGTGRGKELSTFREFTAFSNVFIMFTSEETIMLNNQLWNSVIIFLGISAELCAHPIHLDTSPHFIIKDNKVREDSHVMDFETLRTYKASNS